jgi:hypothetical protein
VVYVADGAGDDMWRKTVRGCVLVRVVPAVDEASDDAGVVRYAAANPMREVLVAGGLVTMRGAVRFTIEQWCRVVIVIGDAWRSEVRGRISAWAVLVIDEAGNDAWCCEVRGRVVTWMVLMADRAGDDA